MIIFKGGHFMTEGLKWTVNEVPKSDDKHLELMSEENVKKANEFHRSFPQYSVTPLQNLSSLAKYLGVKNIHLGPTLPAFLSPNITKVLVDTFGIAGVGTVDDDIKLFME